MVAKPSSALHSNVYELSSSKNPYGSKTSLDVEQEVIGLSSSKNPYGSKTDKNVDQTNFCYLLAKIHMVAKHYFTYK